MIYNDDEKNENDILHLLWHALAFLSAILKKVVMLVHSSVVIILVDALRHADLFLNNKGFHFFEELMLKREGILHEQLGVSVTGYREFSFNRTCFPCRCTPRFGRFFPVSMCNYLVLHV